MLIERLERIALLGSAWVLYLLMLLSVVSIGFIVERVAFYRRHRVDAYALGNELVRLLRGGDMRGAEQLLAASPSLEAAILRPCLGWLDGGPEAVSEIIEAELGKKQHELERGMTFLGTLGNNAPFVGLLGTVLGVIQAFHSLGDAQSQSGMGNVMAAIAEALVATGVGLVVALPAVVAYNVAQKKAADVDANVGVIAKQILALLKRDAKLVAEFRALGEAPVVESFAAHERPEAHAHGRKAAPVNHAHAPSKASRSREPLLETR